LASVDLVILAVPVRALAPVLQQLLPYLNERVILTDVGSVKVPLLTEAAKVLPAPLLSRLVGGHPMAGSERGGVQHANAALLENAIWVLTPTEHTASEVLTTARALVEGLGAQPMVLTAADHDRLVAMISHLPYLSALALTRAVASHEEREGLALLAAGGFRDLTRVASGDPRMSRDMVVENRVALREALAHYRSQLDALEALLDTPETLLQAALEGKRSRDSLPVVRRSLLPALFDLVIAVPDRPGEFARITSILGEHGVNIKDIEVLAIREQGGAIRLGFASHEEAMQGKIILEAGGYSVRGRG
jgi:prephenate dehydrogenase